MEARPYPIAEIGPLYLDDLYTMNPDVIRQLCAIQFWTQQDLADYLNVKKDTVSKWAQGRRRPNPAHMETISRLVYYTNEALRRHGGILPPEARWIPPSRTNDQNTEGVKPPDRYQ